ncbi:hypothetical protein ACWDD9_37665 [Kitasatospora sp. NPDC001119]
MSPEADPLTDAAGRLPRYCRHCDTEFDPTPGTRQIFCSPRCADLARRPAPPPPVVKNCPNCGSEFTHEARVRQVYCSPLCRRDAEKTRDRERDERRARRLGEPLLNRPAIAAGPAKPTLPPAPRPRAGDTLAPTAIRNCPHCDQPITIVALLATPEAARPTIPQPTNDVVPLRRV